LTLVAPGLGSVPPDHGVTGATLAGPRSVARVLRFIPEMPGLSSATGGKPMLAHAARNITTAITVSLLATVLACSGGSAPVMDSVDDQIIAVGSELTLTLRATDPDGDPIDYSFHADVPDLGSRATINRTPAGAGSFRWRPMAADVGTWHFDFIASDGDGAVTVPVTIEVKSAVGDQTTPTFVSRSGRVPRSISRSGSASISMS
jgi:hypothetical protein